VKDGNFAASFVRLAIDPTRRQWSRHPTVGHALNGLWISLDHLV